MEHIKDFLIEGSPKPDSYILYLELDTGRHDDRSEGQRMRAYRCDHDSWHWRMYHTGTGGHGVGCGSSRCADDEAVALYAGHVLAVDEQVDVGEIRRRSAVHHHLVKYQKIRGWFSWLALFALAHDDAAQTTPQRQSCVTCERWIQVRNRRKEYFDCPADDWLPSKTFVTCSWKLSNSKGVKKPREPKWNAMTGGTDCWKRRLA